MIRKTLSIVPALFATLMLSVAGPSTMAAGTNRVTASGGFLYNGSYVATYVNAATANGVDGGQISLTTSDEHLWGFVDHIDWISASEAHVFAHLYGETALLEVDVIKNGAQNMVAFSVTDEDTFEVMAESGETPNGTLAPMPLVGRAMIQKAN